MPKIKSNMFDRGNIKDNGADVFEKNIGGVIEIVAEDRGACGSGFLIGNEGYALTNTHVVTFEDGSPSERLVAYICGEKIPINIVCLGDELHGGGNGIDLALIKLDYLPQDFKSLNFEDYSNVRNGERVFVIGNSLGMGTCITSGIVSDRIRKCNWIWHPYLMIDCPVNGGNSGGPVFNDNGQVIGVVVAHQLIMAEENRNIPASVNRPQGMNYAIPGNYVKEFVNSCNIPSLNFSDTELPGVIGNAANKINAQPAVQTQQQQTAFTKNEVMFCENCGARIDAGSLFCENCGHRVENEESVPVKSNPVSLPTLSKCFTVFESKNWQKEFASLKSENQDLELGIVLTNTSDCPPESLKNFNDALSNYITYKAERGILYCVLDMANQSVKRKGFSDKSSRLDFIVKTLNDVYSVAEPKYTMIIGDRSAIESAEWENGLYDPSGRGDEDKYVNSDIPYITLDTRSPFDGTICAPKMAVGRIPADPSKGFVEACRYMENVMRFAEKEQKTDSLVLTDIEWVDVSHRNFDHLDPDFYSCPSSSFLPVDGLELIDNGAKHDLLCFNLHGCGQHDYWVNGKGIPAYSPRCLPARTDHGYIIATEACYGAKPVIRASGEQSTLITALGNRCLGFVGSTQIAYGIPDSGLLMGGEPLGADILVGRFSKYTAQNYRLGDAYMMALKDIISPQMGGEDIKTIISFALYGDPTVYMNCRATPSNVSKGTTVGGLHLAMPDVRAAVRLSLTKVSEMIANIVSDYVTTYHSYFSDITPKYYTTSDKSSYKASYAKASNNGIDLLNIYFDRNGKIGKVYVSR